MKLLFALTMTSLFVFVNPVHRTAAAGPCATTIPATSNNLPFWAPTGPYFVTRACLTVKDGAGVETTWSVNYSASSVTQPVANFCYKLFNNGDSIIALPGPKWTAACPKIISIGASILPHAGAH